MFGHTGSGEHEWLDQVSDHSHGGGAAGMGGATLTKLSITAKGDDQHRNHEWVDGNPTAVSSNGTNFFCGYTVYSNGFDYYEN